MKRGGKKVTTTFRTGTGWRVKKEHEEAIQCSFIKSPVIYIELAPRRKIELLMEKYTYQEWLGYLVGRLTDKENFFVEDLVIPPHAFAYGASAEAEPFHIPDRCVGIIHSHHSMGAFHSVTDQDHVDKNFPVSITVARGGQGQGLVYDAVSYQTTPCGKSTTSKGVVKYVAPPPPFDTEVFLKDAEKNIDKGKRIYTPNHALTTYNPHFHEDFFTDGQGRVMSQTEINEHLKQIWKDREITDFEGA